MASASTFVTMSSHPVTMMVALRPTSVQVTVGSSIDEVKRISSDDHDDSCGDSWISDQSQPDFLNCLNSSATATAVNESTTGYPTAHCSSGMFSKFMP